MDLMKVKLGQTYMIDNIQTGDRALEYFLFTLGCCSGEPITVVSRRRGGCTVAVKDGRYHIDAPLAAAITVA